MFREDLVILDKSFSNHKEIFEYNFKLLNSLNIVKESYLEAILKREENFPTGIETHVGINIAMPHTDVEHANEEAVLFMRLTEPVEFRSMADPEESVSAKLIFNIVVKEPQDQIAFLMKLMKLLQDKDTMEYLLEENDKQKIVTKLNEFINEGE